MTASAAETAANVGIEYVVTEFCARVIVPALTQLLLPTIAIIDKSGTDHRHEVQALRHAPQALSGIIQGIGPEQLIELLSLHSSITRAVAAAEAAQAAAEILADANVSDGRVEPPAVPQTWPSALAVLPDALAAVTQAPPIGEPISAPVGPEITGL
jgi:hypothetical protein